MRKYWKRILAMVLAVAMIVPSVPMEALAKEQVCTTEEHSHTDYKGECYQLDCKHEHDECYDYGVWQTDVPSGTEGEDFDVVIGENLSETEKYSGAYAGIVINAGREADETHESYVAAYQEAYAANSWMGSWLADKTAKAAGAAAYGAYVADNTTFYRTKTCDHSHDEKCYTLICDKEHTHTAECYTYTITWVDEDGTTILEEDKNVAYGATPEYNGGIPTKEPVTEDGVTTYYNFIGWKNGTNFVTEDVTYTAEFAEVGYSKVVVKANDYAVVTVTVDGEKIESETLVKAGKTVVVSAEAITGYEVTDIQVVDNKGEIVESTADGIKKSFTTSIEVADTYEISVTTVDIRSSVSLDLNSIVPVEVVVEGKDGKFAADEEGNIVDEIDPGKLVTVTVWPNENCYITSATVKVGDEAVAVGTEGKKGTHTLSFRTTNVKNDYVISVSEVPILVANEENVVVDVYDIIAGKFDDVETVLSEGFDAAACVDELSYEYSALVIDGTIASLLGVSEEDRNIWVDIDTDISKEYIKGYLKDKDFDLDSTAIQFILGLAQTSVDEVLDTLLKDVVVFGEEGTKTVRATFKGSEDYPSVTAVKYDVEVVDGRVEVDVELNEEITVAYDSYASNEELLEKLLAGKLGVNVNGVALGEEYNKMLSIDSDLVGADVGTYEVEVAMKGDFAYKDVETTTAKIIVEKADSYTNVSEANVKYGTEVNASALIDTGKADRVELAVGLSIGENASEDLGSVVYLNLPMLVDLSILDELGLSSLKEEINKLTSGKEITISELGKYLSDITGAVEGLGSLGELLGLNIDETAINTLTSVLENLENIEGVGDIKLVVSMGQTLTLKDSGAYLVGAVVTDSNYNTSFGANYVVITPDGYKAVLDWNVKDDNGLVRKDALSTYNFGAKVVEVSEGTIADAQKHVTTFFMGVDANGEATVTYDPIELKVGVYTQIALIKDLGNTMYYAEPIQRVFAVVPQVAEVEVKDVEKVYTGKPQEAEVAVKLADGSEYDSACLQVTYVGLDVNGEVYNSTVAPTNTGAYTILATYLEKDANGVYDHAGFDVGYMVISPAEAELDVADNEYVIYDGEEHWPTITNTKNLELVKIVADDKGNVNVILPAPYDKEKYELNAKDAADELVEILKDIYANNANVAVMAADEASANEIMNEVISRLEAIGVDVYEMIAKAMDVESIIAAAEKRAEEAMKAFMATDLDAVKEQVEATLNGIEVKNLSINGVGPIEEGVYTVSVIGYRENYKLAAARGSIEIHEHDWVAANCTTPKTCEECKETEGEALGHTWGEWYVTKKPTKHSKGEERRDCENCEVYQLRELAKLPSGGGSKHDKDDSEAKLEGVYYAVSEPVTITPAKTGDSANVIGYACAVVAAGAALLYVFLKKKRA